MQTFRFWRVTALLALAHTLLSCSSSGDQTACSPGQSIQCAGALGCVGVQLCNSDGTSYGDCTCGSSGYAVGSSGGHSSTQSPAVGGQAVGGSGSISLTGGNPSCVPTSMNGQAFPPYVPARHMPGSCTNQAITDYYDNCHQLNECSAFMTGGPYETCGTCLQPTPLVASSLGPLLQVGTGSLSTFETNVAGCEEILGEVDCAAKMQIEFLCQYGACANNCPLDDYDSINGLFQCMATALTSQCSNQHAAARCLKSASDVAPCTGSNFQEQFVAVATVFCS